MGGRSHRGTNPVPKRTWVRGSQLVFIRTGKTQYSKLGLFAGWEDIPLTDEGRQEAIAAGKLLSMHGIKFDVVHTSWLSRAIETGWLVCEALDMLWVPMVKTWRLNERMCGSLTGQSEMGIKEQYGEKNWELWYRGF